MNRPNRTHLQPTSRQLAIFGFDCSYLQNLGRTHSGFFNLGVVGAGSLLVVEGAVLCAADFWLHLWPLLTNDRSNPPLAQVTTIKNVPRNCQVYPGGNQLWVKATVQEQHPDPGLYNVMKVSLITQTRGLSHRSSLHAV